MEFEISREALLPPLKIISGIVERKQTLAILANILVRVEGGTLHLTATDSELEIACAIPVDKGAEGSTTIPAFKLFDICRSLPNDAQLSIAQGESRVSVKSGRSRFCLGFLPAEDFPSSEEITPALEFELPQSLLKYVFAKTQFAMAQQDVRYYLNGLLLDLAGGRLNVVATDGHRLALIEETFDLVGHEDTQVIIPRKTVLELTRSLGDSDEPVRIGIAPGHVRFTLPQFVLTSKLIDGRFPDYTGVLPANPDKLVRLDCEQVKQALTRASILSSEQFKGVRLSLTENTLCITAQNPEQEEAEEELDVEYQGPPLEIGFNVVYLLDALGVLDTSEAEFHLSDSNGSCLIQPKGKENAKYVVMPMRL
ncbi:MAG: DNA polymerase III subunit beta [Gammaproteobacteria bacterium]|nr:DNA polymerase III subunit beta [Gammaproteobacteria bacterium]